MIIELTARQLARWIKANDLNNPNSFEVVEYFLLLRLNFWSVIVFGSIIGICINRITEMAIAMAAFWFIRVLSGGYHFSLMTVCSSVTVAILASASLIELSRTAIIASTTICLILNILYSTRSLTMPANQKWCYYAASLWMITSNFVLSSSVVAVCFIAQSILLTIKRR